MYNFTLICYLTYYYDSVILNVRSEMKNPGFI